MCFGFRSSEVQGFFGVPGLVIQRFYFFVCVFPVLVIRRSGIPVLRRSTVPLLVRAKSNDVVSSFLGKTGNKQKYWNLVRTREKGGGALTRS